MTVISVSTQSRNFLYTVVSVVFFLIAMTVFSGYAKAEGCPEISKVSWWGDTTTEGLTAVVDQKHDGDWDPYIKIWESHEEEIRAVMLAGRTAVLHSQGQTLQGDELVGYFKLVEKRIVATRCIADEVIDTRLIEELNNMETSAGGNAELEITLVQ